ncbi:tRNA lysidine(34) synthetase TilS [Marinomonas balearica]|uniref:tRNA(Ile)-lysidine synthase n=1 Tax=Marinomonas balearica TaxID=491947 RepID=A0A4V3CG55_9GAMM|nr:tRNA lysidine(34) synthetase TilS [Marinomonas balearica]TDO96402.1 tRNA(Ile)-lysidine synthase [Marinomonas balearica]
MLKLDSNTLRSFLLDAGDVPISIWVAYSGGLDSEALLHLVSSELESIQKIHGNVCLKAIHVHHGVSANADSWVEHCRHSCGSLQIPLVVEKVTVSSSGSFENAARDARYQAFSKHLQARDVLLQAHHANDQAETLLFRLERGTGLKGMAGIPNIRQLNEAVIWRPLLHYSRSQLEEYAALNQLSWLEDESNQDQSYRRNFLRHSVLSPWQKNNVEIAARLSSSASRIRQEWQVVSRLVDLALSSWCHTDGSLLLNSLPMGEESYWITVFLNKSEISLTSAQADALMDMLFSDVGKQPEYRGAAFRLARRNQRLYVLPLERTPSVGELVPNIWFHCAFGKIKADKPLTLKVRPIGESIALKNGFHRPLKKWLNDQKIPTWWRDHLPYLYDGERLVAIGDLWNHPDWQGRVEWEQGSELIFCLD